MAKIISEIQKLGLDAYKNPALRYNDVSADDAIRNIINEAVGGEFNYYNFIDHKGKFFSVVAELIGLPIIEGLDGIFDGVTKTDTIAIDDVKVVEVEDNELFTVASIAKGNNDIRRQAIYDKKVTVETDKLGVKIYVEFDKFMSGKINWGRLIQRVRKSFLSQVGALVYKSVLTGYDTVSNSDLSKSGSFSEDVLDDLIAKVEAKTGLTCAIYGTKKALGKITKAETNLLSNDKKDEYIEFGYLRNYKGTQMMELKNTVDKNGNFVLGDGTTDDLFILPIGSEIINIVFKGQPLVSESTDGEKRNDQQVELLMEMEVGVATLIAKYYGIYKLTSN